MLRIRVEIVPFGVESQARTLAVVNVGNIGTDAHGVATYTVRPEIAGRALPEFELSRHKRSNGWLPLVKRALGGIKNKEGEP